MIIVFVESLERVMTVCRQREAKRDAFGKCHIRVCLGSHNDEKNELLHDRTVIVTNSILLVFVCEVFPV